MRSHAKALFAVIALLMLLGASQAQASKTVNSFFGNSGATGTQGGQFSTPRGVAVNANGTGGAAAGDVYVVDSSNNRIQQFSAAGAFIRAFGQDVVLSGKANDVSATAFEICDTTAGNVATDCKAGINSVSPAPGGELSSPQGIAVNQVTGNLYVSNQAFLRVEEFDATGHFVRAWGKDVDGALGGTGFEVCGVAASCKAGASSTGLGGEFASTFNGHLAIVPAGAANAGNVLVADPGNRRVQEFTEAGAFVRAFGADVEAPSGGTALEVCAVAASCRAGASSGTAVGQFGTNGPNRIAADSTGAIYTVEQASPNFRVQKFTAQVGPPVLAAALFNPQVSASPAVNLSGTATSDSPVDVAIGAGDRVFVTKVCTAVNCPGASPATERRIYEFSAAGTLTDTHIAGAGLLNLNSLAANAANGRLYVSSSASPQRVYVLADAVAPTATIAAADGVSATGASFHGEVDPGGVLGGYHFEYVEDTEFQASAWANAQVLPETPAGTTPGVVSRAVTGLASGALYHVRLVVKQSFGTLSASSAETIFTTTTAKPIVAPFADVDTGTTSATLSGRVTPSGLATTDRFEWGPTQDYGNSTAPAGAGAGVTPVFASAHLSGLQPHATYHFRLLATNSSGATEGADHTFTTEATIPAICPNAQFRKGLGGLLPGCRAYEQVSPVEKSGVDISGGNESGNSQDVVAAAKAAGGPVAADGNTAVYKAEGGFADAEWGGAGSPIPMRYRARRDAEGWHSTSLLPRPLTVGPNTMFIPALSSDVSASIIFTYFALSAGDPQGLETAATNVYFRDIDTGALRLLYTGTQDAPVGSDDLTTLAFESNNVLTAEPGLPNSSVGKVYEVADGELRLASRRPGDDLPFSTGSSLAGTQSPVSAGLIRLATEAGAISADGRRIFFNSPPPAGVTTNDSVIYRRENGAVTTLASPSLRTPADPLGPRAKFFRSASRDGDRVFFSSPERLTDDANTDDPSTTDVPGGLFGVLTVGDLYRYDYTDHELTNLSAGTVGTAEANVVGTVAGDERGNRVYFAAYGQVVPGQGVQGKPNLYLWQDDGTPKGETRFIATLTEAAGDDPHDAPIWANNEDFPNRALATPDGGKLAFLSDANIDGYDSAGRDEVYLYDAAANDGAGDLSCLSCPLGSPAGENARLPVKPTGSGREAPRFLSESGNRVLFSSPEALVARDTNGMLDPYLWEKAGTGGCGQSGGCVRLLSSGTSDGDSYAFGLSADGGDAFLRTRSQLVDQDVDTNLDLYTAHVGGGFASQQETPPPGCEGEGCQGPAMPPNPPRSPLSSSVRSEGNVAQAPRKRRCAKGKRKVRTGNGKARCIRKRAANNNGRAGR